MGVLQGWSYPGPSRTERLGEAADHVPELEHPRPEFIGQIPKLRRCRGPASICRRPSTKTAPGTGPCGGAHHHRQRRASGRCVIGLPSACGLQRVAATGRVSAPTGAHNVARVYPRGVETGPESTEATPCPDGERALVRVTEGILLDGRYRLQRLLGRGGTAEVYQGIDELLGRLIAVKVFDSRLTDVNTEVRQRREMQVLAALNHRNLIAVYDARIAGGRVRVDSAALAGYTGSGHTYLIMELVQGRTLAQQLAGGAMDPAPVRALGATLASVLATVHGADLVHRDVKPANILLADSGEVKLGDFGLARILTAESRLTTSAAVMGTAAYFSPEQARGRDVGPPGDIYALGLVLLECLTGQREFPGEAVPSALARLLRDPVIPTNLPYPWPSLLSQMTATDPTLRPTATQIADALAFSPGPASHSPLSANTAARTAALPLSELGTAAFATPRLAGSPGGRPHSLRRRRILLAGIGVLLIFGVGTAVVASRSGDKVPGTRPAPMMVPPPSGSVSTKPATLPANAAVTPAATPTRTTSAITASSPSSSASSDVIEPIPSGAVATSSQPINGNGNGKGKKPKK